MNHPMEHYLSGEHLYGDDFTIEEIQEWISDEAERSALVASKNTTVASYDYHQLDAYHGFRFLMGRRFQHALGLGSPYGDEFKPIAQTVSHITILNPFDASVAPTHIGGVPCTHRTLRPNGNMDFESNSFDLIMSLGVLPHIPNVSHVLNECARCLTKGGRMLLREPIVSMGDWRKPRPGLTKRERGIPALLLEHMLANAGLKTIRRSLCTFPILPKIGSLFGLTAYNNPALTVADSLLSRLFAWNTTYHRVSPLEKLGPSSVFYVLTK